MMKLLLPLAAVVAIFLLPGFAKASVADEKLDTICPLKVAFRVTLDKDRTIIPDINWKSESADARYCSKPADYDYCEKNNPVKEKVPCRFVDPLVFTAALAEYC